MTKYNTSNVKLFNSHFYMLNLGINIKCLRNFHQNLIGNPNDETNFIHKLLLNDTQVSKICKAFANGSSANIKYSKFNC